MRHRDTASETVPPKSLRGGLSDGPAPVLSRTRAACINLGKHMYKPRKLLPLILYM